MARKRSAPKRKGSRKSRRLSIDATPKKLNLASGFILSSSIFALVLATPSLSSSATEYGARVPSAMAATQQDTDATLCAEFTDLGINCVVRWAYSEDKNQGTLLKQTPVSGKKSAYATLTYSKGAEEPLAPLLTGLTQEEATRQLWERGLVVGQVSKQAASTPAGVVLSSSVSPNRTVPNGSSVDLTVSTGKITVPNWKGKTKELVQSESANLDIKVEFVEKKSSGPIGVVLKQNIVGENDFDKVVRLTISKQAKDAEKVAMPNVVGKTQLEAVSLLASEGFLKIVTNGSENADITKAKVVATNPKPGKKVDPSKTLVLTVR